jgi:hypothetical protein
VETVLQRVGILSNDQASAPTSLDVAYESRYARMPEEIRLDLIARLGLLNSELNTGEIDERALEISEGQRIKIRINRL